MTLFFRCTYQFYCRTKCNTIRCKSFTIYRISDIVIVQAERSVYSNILCRHRSRESAPAIERISLLNRCCYRRYCCTGRQLFSVANMSVNPVLKSIQWFVVRIAVWIAWSRWVKHELCCKMHIACLHLKIVVAVS